jgi:hypothetical protein
MFFVTKQKMIASNLKETEEFIFCKDRRDELSYSYSINEV